MLATSALRASVTLFQTNLKKYRFFITVQREVVCRRAFVTVVTSPFFLHFCRQQKASSSQKTTCQDLSEVKRGGNKKAAAVVASDLLQRRSINLMSKVVLLPSFTVQIQRWRWRRIMHTVLKLVETSHFDFIFFY